MKLFGLNVPRLALLFGPALAMSLGFLSNAIVMAVNHGRMPVLMPSGLEGALDTMGDPYHSVMTAQTHLKALCDWIVIRDVGIASPGDFLEWGYEYFGTPLQAAWLALTIADYNKK